MDLLTTKIVVAVLFFVIRFFFGVLPVKLYRILKRWEGDDNSGHFINQKRHHQVNLAIALCQSFGGGVLFATCFLHMMLEVNKSMEDLKKFGNVNTDYPLSQLAICIGFFFVYFLEEISYWAIARIPENKPAFPTKFNNFTHHSVTPLNSSELRTEKAFTIEQEYQKSAKNEEDIESTLVIEEDGDSVEKIKEELSIDEDNESIVYDSLQLDLEAKENEKNLELNIKAEGNEKAKQQEEIEKEEKKKEKQEFLEVEIKSKQQLMRGCLIIIALSSHSIFEGLAIGLQKVTGDIWYLFIAVCIHSATILFCMSLEMVLAKVKTKAIVLQSLGLAVSSPIGVILGILVTLHRSAETRARSMAVVSLEGLSTGTILYITFFQVLNREKQRRSWRISRSICILSGFTLMAYLQWYR